MIPLPARLLPWLLAAALFGGCTPWSRTDSTPAASAPTETAPPATEAVAPGPEAALAADPTPVGELFPASSYTLDYDFDDGTPRLTEQLLVTPERVVGIQGGVPYVTWHIRPGGLYRRDPLGGSNGALLRYLPAQLQDNLAWKQESAGATIWFRLRATTECGRLPAWVTAPRHCWELHILNRGQSQWFRFAPGLGIVAARILSLDRPAESFHKTATGEGLLLEAEAAEALQAVAEAGTWDERRVTPVQEATAAAFARAEAEWLGRGAVPVAATAGATAGYLIGPWEQWTETGLIFVRGSDSTNWEYRPLGQGRQRFHLVSKPEPFVVMEEQPGGPEQAQGQEQAAAVQVRAFTLDRLEPLQWLTWGESGPDRLTAQRVEVSPDGSAVAVVGPAEGAKAAAGTQVYRLERPDGSAPFLRLVQR